jgi:hypothetical protein
MPLVICTGLMGDWYGVANAGAIVMSTAARMYILGQQRQARDKFMRPPGNDKEKVYIVIQPDGKMVTLRGTNTTLHGILRTPALPGTRYMYGLAQQAAWVALGTHLLVLGMCTLVTQIYTVVLLVTSTVAISSTTDWSADTQHKTTTPRQDWLNDTITTIPFNDHWDIIKTDPARRMAGSNDGNPQNLDRRMVAWARLRLSREEEATMRSWTLFPDEAHNVDWWEDYRGLRDEFAAARHRNSDTCSPPSSSHIALQHMQPSVQSPQLSSSPAT